MAPSLVRSHSFDVATRVVAALILGVFALAAARALHVPSASHRNLAGWVGALLLLVGETLNVILVAAARRTKEVDRTLRALVTTAWGSFCFLFIDLNGGHRLLAHGSGIVQIAGLGLQVCAKLWLGRRFGLLPANRGITTTGPYRIVRHPVYLGYLINHVGFILGAFSLRNVVILALLYAAQIMRIIQEERLLSADIEYVRYKSMVPYRLIPLVF